MKVKDISIINPKSNIKNFDFINYIDTSSVYDGTLDTIQCLEDNIPSRAQRELKLNDILISSVRPCLKHNYLVKSNESNLVGSTGFIQVRINDKNWLPKYVYYYLTSEKNIKYYDNVANFSQTAYPSFNKDLIEELGLPCVSLAKQQHIVNIVRYNI